MSIETKAQEIAWLKAERDRITTTALDDCRKLLRAAAASAEYGPSTDGVRAVVTGMCVTLLAQADQNLLACDHGLIVRGAA